ncbi:MAG TPA: hypothetical protein VGE67_12635 [Haloferula sp.]
MELPDPLFRDLKIKAAEEGVTLKELLTGFVEKGLYGTGEPEKKPVWSPLPPPLQSSGVTIPSLTNAQIDEMFLREDMERWGTKMKP